MEDKREDPTKRILFMEDEAFWADILISQFKKADSTIQITHAKNGEEGIRYVQKTLSEVIYDAIITDIQMPIMDGSTAVSIMRQELSYTNPVIVWSAIRDTQEELEAALDIPVNGICKKDHTIEELLKLLKELGVLE